VNCYEGTGRNGRSSLRRVALDTGEVLQRRNLGNLYFRRRHHHHG